MSPARRAITALLNRIPAPPQLGLSCRRHGERPPEARPLDCALCLADLQAELPRLFAALREHASWIREARDLLRALRLRQEVA